MSDHCPTCGEPSGARHLYSDCIEPPPANQPCSLDDGHAGPCRWEEGA